jgi:hypothetical protein
MSSSFIIQKGPGIASKAYNYAKKLITGGPKVSPTITSVAAKFPKNKIQAAVRDVQKTAYAARGQMKKKNQDFDRDIQKVKSKLGQSMQKLKGEPVTESGVSKGKDIIKRAKGGRVGLKRGTGLIPKKKSNVDKIKKSFGTLSVRAGIDNNPNPTYADKIAGAKMKNKKTKKKII